MYESFPEILDKQLNLVCYIENIFSKIWGFMQSKNGN